MFKVPYERWIKEGWITETSGAVVDYRAVMAWAIDQIERKGWFATEWCIDSWGALQLSNDLTEAGNTVVEIVQGIKTLSEPTKDFRDMVYAGRVVHDGNPVLAWAVGNAIADTVDRNENVILNKKKSKERIDPIAATINAHVRAMTRENSGGVYNQRGMRSFA
jgi:phage terminase large subunit-like protein